MRDKHGGRKAKTREVRDPEAECEAAAYKTAHGEYGVPAMAVKSALITAAHKDLGIEKTLVRKALFLHCDDPNGVLPFSAYEGPELREDTVRIGMGSTDLRYRPEFRNWAVTLDIEFDVSLIQENDIAALIERAGFGTGVGEWRPEKGGEFGRFRIATEADMKEVRDAA